MANKFLRSRPTTNWAVGAVKALGDRVKATSATLYLGIHFECTTAGTTHAATEPTWNTTVGGTTIDNTVTWTTRGSAREWAASLTLAVGDRMVPTRAYATAAAKSYVYECTTGGTMSATQPTWVSTTPDTSTTTDGAVFMCRKPETWDNASIYMDYLIQDTAGTGKMLAADTVYVSKNHSETTAAGLSITMPGDAATPNVILCVDDNGDPASPTARATTALVATTGASSINLAGFAYCYGVSFKAGSGNVLASVQFVSTASSTLELEQSTLEIAATGTNYISIGRTDVSSLSQRVKLVNSNIKFADATSAVRLVSAELEWVGGSYAASGVVPTNAFIGFSPIGVMASISGVDFGTFGAGKNIVSVSSMRYGAINFHGCKLGASVTPVTGTYGGNAAPTVGFFNCDDTTGNLNYRLHVQSYAGTITQSSAVYLNASDGTTSVSRKAVTTANAKFRNPLALPPIAVWNETVGSPLSVTVEVVHDSVTALNNDEAWIEVEFLGSSTSPQTTIEMTDKRTSELTAAVPQTTSTAAWVGTGGFANVSKQELVSGSFTPQKKGLIIIRPYLARATYTAYFNEKVTVA